MSVCNSCSDLQAQAPSLEATGEISQHIVNSVRNGKGIEDGDFHGDITNKNCDDLNKFNDCYIDGLEDEVDAYNSCSWKDYIKKAVSNIHGMFKLVISWVCGIWERVGELEDITINSQHVNLWDFDNNTFAKNSDGSRRLVLNSGVNLNMDIITPQKSTIPFTCSVGAYKVTIPLSFSGSRWENLGPFNNNGTLRSGSDLQMNTPSGNYVIGVVRILRDDMPNIKALLTSTGNFANVGVATVASERVKGSADGYDKLWGDEGTELYRWLGYDNISTFEDDVKHKYLYLKLSVVAVISWGHTSPSNPKVSPNFTGTCTYQSQKGDD